MSKNSSVVDPLRFNGDRDSAFYLNADPDPESQANPVHADPDPGQILMAQKVVFFYMKTYLRKYKSLFEEQ